MKFPDELVETLYSYKLSNQDINFNAITVVFEIHDEAEVDKNLKQLTSYLNSEGFELLCISEQILDPRQ